MVCSSKQAFEQWVELGDMGAGKVVGVFELVHVNEKGCGKTVGKGAAGDLEKFEVFERIVYQDRRAGIG